MHSGPEYDIEPLTALWRDMDSGALAIAIQPLSRIFNDDVEPDSNRQFMRPRTFPGMEKGLRHFPRGTPAFPIRNSYTGHDTEYTTTTLPLNVFHSVSTLFPPSAAD